MERSRPRRNEDGFTLVEIMVVVLIIAVLMTIAIPVFANFRARAYDRQAHATLRNLYTVEQGHLVDHGYYAALGNPYLFTWDDAIRADYDPQFESVLDTGSWEDPLALEIAVGGVNATRICLIVQSKTGRFFVMKLIADTDPDVLEGTLLWEPPLYGYTDNPTGWNLECLSGPTLTYDSWN